MDQTILARLGLVVTLWSRVEALCGELLERMLKATPGTHHILTPTVSNATVVSWMRTLAADRFARAEFRDEVLALLAELDEARADRNAFVHGLWLEGPGAESAMVNSVRFDRPEIMASRLVTARDLDDLADHIAELRDRLATCIGAIDPSFGR